MSLAPLRTALKTVFDADAGVRLVTNKKTKSLLARGAQKLKSNWPLMTYYVVSAPQMGGTKGRRKVTIQFEAWVHERRGSEDVAIAILETLMDRAEALFVGSVMSLQEVDISRPRIVNRQDREFPLEGDGECLRTIRADFHFVYTTST